MPRHFNTAGPCRPDWHYMIPAERRLPEAEGLVEQAGYFVVHAPRQSGKTTVLRTLAAQLTASGRYAALHFTCETGEAAEDDFGEAQRAILSHIRRSAEIHLPAELHPPPFPEAPNSSLLHALELKLWREQQADPLSEGLVQLDAYLERLGLHEGVLIIFDRRAQGRAIQPGHFEQALTSTGRNVTVLRV